MRAGTRQGLLCRASRGQDKHDGKKAQEGVGLPRGWRGALGHGSCRSRRSQTHGIHGPGITIASLPFLGSFACSSCLKAKST